MLVKVILEEELITALNVCTERPVKATSTATTTMTCKPMFNEGIHVKHHEAQPF